MCCPRSVVGRGGHDRINTVGDIMETVLAVILLATLGVAIYSADQIAGGKWNLLHRPEPGAAKSFPAVMPRDAHWQRATGVVDLALTRAATMVAWQNGAARQLEAADYALHTLLDELRGVMEVSIQSPLATRARTAPSTTPQARPALAA